MDYKLNLITPCVYSKPGNDNCIDTLAEEFAGYVKHRADNEFNLPCKYNKIPGLAFIHSFTDFEERFLLHSEYAVIIGSPTSKKQLNQFLPRLLVFLSVKPIWQNRFLIITLGEMQILDNLLVHAPIKFSLDNWREGDEESWIRLFNLLKVQWVPYHDPEIKEDAIECESKAVESALADKKDDRIKDSKNCTDDSMQTEEHMISSLSQPQSSATEINADFQSQRLPPEKYSFLNEDNSQKSLQESSNMNKNTKGVGDEIKKTEMINTNAIKKQENLTNRNAEDKEKDNNKYNENKDIGLKTEKPFDETLNLKVIKNEKQEKKFEDEDNIRNNKEPSHKKSDLNQKTNMSDANSSTKSINLETKESDSIKYSDSNLKVIKNEKQEKKIEDENNMRNNKEPSHKKSDLNQKTNMSDANSNTKAINLETKKSDSIKYSDSNLKERKAPSSFVDAKIEKEIVESSKGNIKKTQNHDETEEGWKWSSWFWKQTDTNEPVQIEDNHDSKKGGLLSTLSPFNLFTKSDRNENQDMIKKTEQKNVYADNNEGQKINNDVACKEGSGTQFWDYLPFWKLTEKTDITEEKCENSHTENQGVLKFFKSFWTFEISPSQLDEQDNEGKINKCKRLTTSIIFWLHKPWGAACILIVGTILSPYWVALFQNSRNLNTNILLQSLAESVIHIDTLKAPYSIRTESGRYIRKPNMIIYRGLD